MSRRKVAGGLDATMEVGKAGVTEALVVELRNQLDKRTMVKVRLRRSALGAVDRRTVAQDLAVKTGADLVEVRGNTAVLRQRGGADGAPERQRD